METKHECTHASWHLSSIKASLRRANARYLTSVTMGDASVNPAPARALFKRGQKATNAPVSSSIDHHDVRQHEAKVEEKLSASIEAWSAKRGSNASNLPCAIWRDAVGRAEVVQVRGRHFHRFGCARAGATWLLPEECAFLVETERLALFWSEDDEEVASVRSVYALLARCGIEWEDYAAYSHLCRLGYVTLRYGASWTTDAREGVWASTVGKGKWARRTTTTTTTSSVGGEEEEDDEDAGNGEDVIDPERASKRRRLMVESSKLANRASATVDERGQSETVIKPTSRRWWPWSGSATHAWLGPSIETAVDRAVSTGVDKPVKIWPTFQIYQPNRNFSKKSPDPVSFYVYVRSDRPLDGREAQALLDKAEGKPVRVASCRQSTVVMFTIAGRDVY